MLMDFGYVTLTEYMNTPVRNEEVIKTTFSEKVTTVQEEKKTESDVTDEKVEIKVKKVK